LEQSYEEYSEEFNLESFDSVVLERESFDEFHLDLGTKDEKLFIGLKLSLGQIHDLINEIETFVKDMKQISNHKYLPGVQMEDDEGKLFLEIPTDQTFILITFSSKDEVSNLLTELKKASGWTKEILNKGKDDGQKVQEEKKLEEEGREAQYQLYQKETEKKKEALKPLIEYLSSKTNNEIISEIIDYIKKKFSVEKFAMLKVRDVSSCRTEFFDKKGSEDHDWWYLPEKMREKYRKIRYTIQDKMEDEILTSQMELINKLVPECVNFAQSEDKKKFSYSDLDDFLFSKKLKIRNKMRSLLHSKINQNLKNALRKN